jgi:60 kDa SS-A/Ro ribonucleoprotein
MKTYVDAATETVRPLNAGEAVTHEGGIAFQVDHWTRLRRFLILGSERPFYSSTAELTAKNIGAVRKALDEDAQRTVGEIVAVSHGGLAPKNDPALLALAMATLHPEVETRRIGWAALPSVARIGTHILHFQAYRKALGGGSNRQMRRALGKWFSDRPAEQMAYQAVKYPSRDGWAQSDLLRLAHPKMAGIRSDVARYIVDGEIRGDQTPPILDAHRRLSQQPESGVDMDLIAQEVRGLRIPREALNTAYLNDPDIWMALLDDMPMTAMIRNLGKMGSLGLLDKNSEGERLVGERLIDGERLKKARVHPITILSALKVYEQGRGVRGKLTWTPNTRLVGALDEAFYASFSNVEPTGKRIRAALDVSSSMGSPANGMEHLTNWELEGAMALVTAATEPNVEFMAYAHELKPIDIRPSMRLDEVMRTMRGLGFGGTLCTLPIQEAIVSGAEIDTFISYTDGETWNGGTRALYGLPQGRGYDSRETAAEAMVRYRQRSGIAAQHIMVAFAANEFSIADPHDPLMLDCAGADASLPTILSGFMRGEI